jgi:hypothetical protein
MTYSGAPGLNEAAGAYDSHCLIRCQMIRSTPRCSHFGHHQSPNCSRHSESIVKLGMLVIHTMMHEGRLMKVVLAMRLNTWVRSDSSCTSNRTVAMGLTIRQP